MTRKKWKAIERPVGRGRVFRDDVEIAEVEYSIEVIQESLVTSSHDGQSEIEGLKQMRGKLTVVSGERNLLTGETFTLRLEDSRSWKFLATRGDPISGTYSAVNAAGGGLVHEQ